MAIFVLAKSASRVFPESDSNAALPSLLEFFFVGAASYFLYKRNAEKPFFDSAFPVFASVGTFLFILGGTSRAQLLPLVVWIIFFGLILEHPASFCSRFVSPMFTHRLPQFLGRISFSLYLSHMLLMSIAQFCTLKLAPNLPQPVHFVLLLTTTVLGSVALSALLYRYLEVPGIEFGKRLAQKFLAPSTESLIMQPEPRRKRWFQTAPVHAQPAQK